MCLLQGAPSLSSFFSIPASLFVEHEKFDVVDDVASGHVSFGGYVLRNGTCHIIHHGLHVHAVVAGPWAALSSNVDHGKQRRRERSSMGILVRSGLSKKGVPIEANYIAACRSMIDSPSLAHGHLSCSSLRIL